VKESKIQMRLLLQNKKQNVNKDDDEKWDDD
jgi:hypothetical protein